jgi:hypothetical protein
MQPRNSTDSNGGRERVLVACLRVSTAQQGRSGLGIEAQRAATHGSPKLDRLVPFSLSGPSKLLPLPRLAG